MPKWNIVCLAVAVVSSKCLAVAPIAEERTLGNSEARYFWPTGSDYNGDGVDDLLGGIGRAGSEPDRMLLINGLTGSTLRSYTLPPGYGGDFVFTRAATIPDLDGDGRREFVFANASTVWAVRSTSVGGAIGPANTAFTLSNLPFGLHLASSDHTIAIASGDESKLLFVDAATGAIQARISNSLPIGYAIGSLGQSAVNVGDLNNDGVDDFASSGGNITHGSQNPLGTVYLLNGNLRTSGSDYVPIQQLPAGSVLGELTGINEIGAGDAGLWHNTTVNLGDPNPADSVRQSLLVSGAPTSQSGQLAAHVLTPGGQNVALVATHTGKAGEEYGSELVDLGDVNGDGVHDLAEFSGRYSNASGDLLGRIEIISGRGLLDGFDPAVDVLQTIDGLPDAFFYGSFQNLGDYDHDGRIEIGITVLFNGNGNRYGYAQRIFEVVPEPRAISLGLIALILAQRTRHHSVYGT